VNYSRVIVVIAFLLIGGEAQSASFFPHRCMWQSDINYGFVVISTNEYRECYQETTYAAITDGPCLYAIRAENETTTVFFSCPVDNSWSNWDFDLDGMQNGEDSEWWNSDVGGAEPNLQVDIDQITLIISSILMILAAFHGFNTGIRLTS